ncbi:MAG: hypothetical protein DRO11_03735 [Methanobacteriota archaeon]|nr:MAG: hypothetical protein DRO11_03735 [Euryarchaeota archaeon]
MVMVEKTEYYEIGRAKIESEVFKKLVPQGFPRNSLIIVSGEGGTGKSVIATDIVIQFLLKNEPVVYVCLDDTPRSVLQYMNTFTWNIPSYVEKGLLHFLDCFSFRNKHPPQKKEFITIISNPSDLSSFSSHLERTMENMSMTNKGLVVIDSLTELMTMVKPLSLIEAVKTWKSLGPKDRQVMFLATLHYGIRALEETVDMVDYIADGIIDLRYEPNLMAQGVLLKQIRVRKLKGTKHESYWLSFETTEKGITPLNTPKHVKPTTP